MSPVRYPHDPALIAYIARGVRAHDAGALQLHSAMALANLVILQVLAALGPDLNEASVEHLIGFTERTIEIIDAQIAHRALQLEKP